MGRKRKSDATRLDEVDRSMYTTFCGAANSLSQLYTQAMHQQRLSFQAGERHAMEKVNNWILRQHEDGLRVTIGDIFTYLQNELDYGTDEPPSSPRLPFQQHQQTQNAIPGAAALSVNAFGPATIGQGFRSGISDQTKNSVFSNALSSPVRRSLQHYHQSNSGNQTRDPNPPSSNDSSMDMHPDSPGHDSPC
ncbi:uncharacterized protein [Primulina eburnea]|uniref:uncharacterized protein n=1 Tax=Primulina eburnea TaxID=1245227 RepID=UPI003C6BF3FA